jgi:hypothetical protein
MKFGYDNNDPSRKPMPGGWYICEIVKSEVKNYRKKNLHYVVLTLRVIEKGMYAGRQIIETLHIGHPTSKAARKYAVDKMSKICEALDISFLSDTNKLHKKPILAYIVPNKNRMKTQIHNIMDYRKVEIKSKKKQFEDKIKYGAA